VGGLLGLPLYTHLWSAFFQAIAAEIRPAVLLMWISEAPRDAGLVFKRRFEGYLVLLMAVIGSQTLALELLWYSDGLGQGMI